MSGENANGAAVALEDADMPPERVQDNWGMRLWSWVFGGSHSEDSEMTEAHRNGCRMTRLEFEQAIEDRRSEGKVKAEEDRLEGLRRIASAHTMMSRTGTSSVEPFPNEIWLQILKKMSPQERYSMCQVHPVFQDLLKSTYLQDILFPLVLDNELPLAKHLLKRQLPVIGIVVNYFRPSMKQLKILRLVSKSLRDSVDELIESRLLNLMRDIKPRGQFQETWEFLNSVDLYASQREEELERILENSRGLKRFFLRALSVDFSDGKFLIFDRGEEVRPHFDNLKVNVTELLENLGSELLFFKMTIDSVPNLGLGLTSLDLYNHIRQMLMLMPNLKWLVLEVRSYLTYHPEFVSTTEYEAMPRLCHLERFDLNGSNDIWIGDAIISANPQIKIDGMSIGDDRYFNNPVWLGVPLESLSFEMIGAFMTSTLLQWIPAKNRVLKRLSVKIYTLTDDLSSMDDVLQFIQRFPTLEDISLSFNRLTIAEEMNFMRLPNLKHFSLDFGPRVEYSGESEFFFSLQFLFHCKKLTTLVWRNMMRDSKPIRRMMISLGAKEGIWMDFKGGSEDLSKSNVWDVFPQLRIFKVRFSEEKNHFLGWGPSEARWFHRQYRMRELVAERVCRVVGADPTFY